ncbi:MAG TPA: YlzJ-like family protein [Pseudoneobacillus sp.]|nr:YlzJ-like family protein [Pseudoneobacillus sp.]
MILYTMMPYELIYPTDTAEYDKQMMVQYDGIPLLVEQLEDNSYQVLRIMSSDPKHFLDNRYFPGSKISLIN